MKTLTVKEAIEQGYTCALSQDADYYITLEDLSTDPSTLEYHELYLGSKETFNFSISEGSIENMFEEYIENQDEVNDESETLYTQLGDIDFKSIAEMVNKAFTTDYHSVTDIKLIP
jgi:hypothetical protein